MSFLMKIIPTMDPKAAKKLEADLNKRFSNVAKKFSKALADSDKQVSHALDKGVRKAGRALAGAGILAMLTNPLDNTLSRIESILQTADTTGEIARDFGVDPAQLQGLENTMKVYGVTNEEFRQMLTLFSVELGKAKTGESETLKLYKDLDTLQAFNLALGQISTMKDENLRQTMLSNIFGMRKTGAFSAFITATPEERVAKFEQVKVQNPGMYNEMIRKGEGLNEQNRINEILNQNTAFIRDMQTISNKTLEEMKALQAARDITTTQNIQNFSSIAAVAQATEAIQQMLVETVGPIMKQVLPMLPDAIRFLRFNVEVFSHVGSGIIDLFGNLPKWLGGGKK